MIKVEKTLSLHDIDLTADLYSYRIQVTYFSTEVVSLILDELHNHIHSAVIDLEREHVESYLCVCVLVYIYMNLSFIVP